QLLERVRALPSVGSAALTSVVPLSGNGWNQEVVLGGEHKGEVNLARVSAGYLQTMHIPLIAGRDFGAQDTATSPKVAIVNRSFAKKYFAGHALGQTFHMDVDIGQPDPVYEIVGLMNDSKYFDLREPSGPIAYLPEWQEPSPDEYTAFLVRSQV